VLIGVVVRGVAGRLQRLKVIGLVAEGLPTDRWLWEGNKRIDFEVVLFAWTLGTCA